MKNILTIAGMACALMGTLVTAQAQSVTLYDGAGAQTLAQAPWNWTYAQFPPAPNVSGTAQGGATNLNTTVANALMAGYSLLSPVTLDNTVGYDLAFDMQVVSEAHGTRVDRSGVSLIALGSDNKGVELAFWNNEVWTQSDIFTHSTGTESSLFDTNALTHYDLVVANEAYTLTANGTTLLTGSLHSYAAPPIPYKLTDYLFIGDDTTSANGSVNIVRVALVPEPGALTCLIGLGVTSIGWVRRKRGKAGQEQA